MTYVSHSNVGSVNYDSVSGEWTIGALNNGVTKVLKLTCLVPSGQGEGDITNTTTAAFTNHSEDPDLVADDLSETISVVFMANLTNKIVVDKFTVEPGEVLTYTITIENLGPEDATSVLSENIECPSDTTYVVFNDSSGTTYNPSTDDWTIGTLLNGESATLELECSVDLGTEGELISNEIERATLNENDPITTGDDLEAETSVNELSDLEVGNLCDTSDDFASGPNYSSDLAQALDNYSNCYKSATGPDHIIFTVDVSNNAGSGNDRFDDFYLTLQDDNGGYCFIENRLRFTNWSGTGCSGLGCYTGNTRSWFDVTGIDATASHGTTPASFPENGVTTMTVRIDFYQNSISCPRPGEYHAKVDTVTFSWSHSSGGDEFSGSAVMYGEDFCANGELDCWDHLNGLFLDAD